MMCSRQGNASATESEKVGRGKFEGSVRKVAWGVVCIDPDDDVQSPSRRYTQFFIPKRMAKKTSRMRPTMFLQAWLKMFHPLVTDLEILGRELWRTVWGNRSDIRPRKRADNI